MDKTNLKTFNDLPLYKITANDIEDGIFKMSIVEDPAVEIDFLKFNKQQKPIYFFNEEKRIITGVALRANYPIYRFDGDESFYLIFTPEDIEIMAHKFMKNKLLNNVNINHSTDVNDIYLIESYILKENHKIKQFESVEPGSWIVSYKVDNDKIWQDIKKGKLKGFSVEMTGDINKFNKSKEELMDLYNMINIMSVEEIVNKR